MIILILTTHLNKGGISRYVINIAKGLIDQKHKVWVACGGGEWVKALTDAGINYKFIPIKTKSICSPKILLSFLHLRKLILKENIDIVHCNTRVTQFLGFIIHKMLSIPYISAFHGFYKATIFRKLFKLSGILTIAVSKAVKIHLKKDLKILENKIEVIYNGIDFNNFFIEKVKRADFNLKIDDYLIGILGRISEEKGHFLAVKAIHRLSSKYKNIYLLISGKGKLEDRLKSRIKDMNLEQKVKFINSEPNQFLEMIDLLLVPSKKEGFGYSIIEAFIKGIPVIGYNVGGIAEIIKDGKNGILFYKYESAALSNAIEKIMLNQPLRKEIAANAQKDVLYFSMERMAMDTEKIYREALKMAKKN